MTLLRASFQALGARLPRLFLVSSRSSTALELVAKLLSPFRALLALLGAFLLTSCEPSTKDKLTTNLDNQVAVFSGLATTLKELAGGSDLDEGIARLDKLVDAHRDLKRELNLLTETAKEGEIQAVLTQRSDYLEANQQFFEALTTYEASSHNSPKVQRTLKQLHDPAPLKNEGKSD